MFRAEKSYALVMVWAIAAKKPKERVMIPPREVMRHVLAEPFEPFRIHTASGRTFEVRHPEFVQVGRNTMTVYSPPETDPEGPERWEKLSFMLIESIAPLSTPANTASR